VSRLAALSLSMLLFLVAFPLISLGTTRGLPIWWWLGLSAFVGGGLIPPARRFLTSPAPEPPPSRAGMRDDCRVS
jgi:hypothetical protein